MSFIKEEKDLQDMIRLLKGNYSDNDIARVLMYLSIETTKMTTNELTKYFISLIKQIIEISKTNKMVFYELYNDIDDLENNIMNNNNKIGINESTEEFKNILKTVQQL